MVKENLTATEVRMKEKEAINRLDKIAQTLFDPIYKLSFRILSRYLLQSALEGTSQDRMLYCRNPVVYLLMQVALCNDSIGQTQ